MLALAAHWYRRGPLKKTQLASAGDGGGGGRGRAAAGGAGLGGQNVAVAVGAEVAAGGKQLAQLPTGALYP